MVGSGGLQLAEDANVTSSGAITNPQLAIGCLQESCEVGVSNFAMHKTSNVRAYGGKEVFKRMFNP